MFSQGVIDVARKIARRGQEEQEEEHGLGAWDEAITAGACREPENPMPARAANASDPCSMENLVGAKEGSGDGVNAPPESQDQAGNNGMVESGVKQQCAIMGKGPENKGDIREDEHGGQRSDKLDDRLGFDLIHVGELDMCKGELKGSDKQHTSGQDIRVFVDDRLETGAGRPSEEPRDLSGRNFWGIAGGVGRSQEDGGKEDLEEGFDLQGRMPEGERKLCPSHIDLDRVMAGRSAIAVNSGRCTRDVTCGLVGGTDVQTNDTDEPAQEDASRWPVEEQAGKISSALLLRAEPVGEQATSWQTRGSVESDDRPPELQALNRDRGYKVQRSKRTEQGSCNEQSSLSLSETNDEQTRRERAAAKIQACARRMAASLQVACIRRGTQTSQDLSINAVTDAPQPQRPPQFVPMLSLASMVTSSSSADVNVGGAVAASKAPREPLAILRRLNDRPKDQPKVKTDQFRLRVTTRSAIEAHVRKTGALRRKVRPLPTPPSWRSAGTVVMRNRTQQPRSARRVPLMQPRAISPLHRSVMQLNWFVSAAVKNEEGGGAVGPSRRGVERLTCAIFEAEKLVDREFARRGRRRERQARLDP